MTGVTRNATAASERVADGCTVVDGVLIADRQSDVQLDPGRYRVLVRQVLEAEGVPPGTETAVTFVDRDEMAELNESHMGHAGPTDVLAFPLDLVPDAQAPNGSSADAPGTGDPGARPDVTGPALVGDVVVCPAVAAVNAAAGRGSRPGHDGSVTAEIDLLVVHGVLHLLGMDHREPSETAAMRARETEHLRSLWSRS